MTLVHDTCRFCGQPPSGSVPCCWVAWYEKTARAGIAAICGGPTGVMHDIRVELRSDGALDVTCSCGTDTVVTEGEAYEQLGQLVGAVPRQDTPR